MLYCTCVDCGGTDELVMCENGYARAFVYAHRPNFLFRPSTYEIFKSLKFWTLVLTLAFVGFIVF
jgi:hypothetical protein